MRGLRSLTNRQLVVGAFAAAGVAALTSFLILLGGLDDAREARAAERSRALEQERVATLEAGLAALRAQMETVRAASAVRGAAGSDGRFAALAAGADRLVRDLSETLSTLPGAGARVDLAVVPAEGVKALRHALARQLDAATLLRDQARGFADVSASGDGGDGDRTP